MKIKALINIAILQWTLGSPLGGIPVLGTLFSIAKGSELLWVHPSPLWRLAAPGEGAGWLCSCCLFSGKSGLVKWNESCVHFKEVYI